MTKKSKKEQHKSKIGGQALIEGVMMRGIHQSAMACRLPNGEIDLEVWDENNGKDAPLYRRIPFVRGIFNFISSLIVGYKCLMKSAEKQVEDEEVEEEELSKFERWLNEKFGEHIMKIVMVISLVLSLAVSILLFMYIPSQIVALVTKVYDSNVLKTVLEGVIKIAIFIGYLAVTSLMKDIKRTYQYHGAEHKTIACYEAGLELNVENVKKQSRFHPRCGTSFIFFVLFISIFIFCFVTWGSVWERVLIKFILMPVIMGISYEVIRLAGRYDNIVTRIISAPGLQLQRLTTREPDDSMMEVAIAAMKPCIPENLEEDKW